MEKLRIRDIRNEFIGLDTQYTLATGIKSRRVFLDSTASTLMMKPAYDTMTSFFRHYANTHSNMYFSAKISSQVYEWAHNRVLDFLHADRDEYACFFTGSGTTAGINRMARVFRDYRPDRKTTMVSIMEHHSNDLPHRKHMERVIHLPLESPTGNPGCVDLHALEKELKKNRDRINYIAITGVSNVTGIINPIYDAAVLAHRYGALVLVDGAQMASHVPVQISGHTDPLRNIDAFVFSGHKTYAPGSPGVVVCRKDILSAIEPEEVGGGMVEQVLVDSYIIKDFFPDREEAGTPNIPGAVALAVALDILDSIGMDEIYREETEFINDTLDKMKEIDGIQIYGETDCSICPRSASVSFNVAGLDHGIVAAILNDYHNIAVRNECFCAHPYVKKMIEKELPEDVLSFFENDPGSFKFVKPGMVRASFGIYNTREDAGLLVAALKNIIENAEEYRDLYRRDEYGDYKHRSFTLNVEDSFTIDDFLEKYKKDLSTGT